MSIVETALVFVGIPAAIIVVAAAAVYGRGTDRPPRYRPGMPWQFEPVWYLPHPDHAGPVSSLDSAGHSGAHSALPGGAHSALPGGAHSALPGQLAETVTANGGASGEW
jgi:hypothetical protein